MCIRDRLCTAAEETTGFGTVIGNQRTGSLCRIYCTNLNARIELLTKGMVLRGVHCQPNDKNPFVVCAENGQEREIPSTRLTIGNIPLSFSNEEILKSIEQSSDIKTRSRLMDERARDEKGKLSHFKTGRRFIYIDVPKEGTPQNITNWTPQCHNVPQGTESGDMFCLLQGHYSSTCTSPV